MRTLIVSLAILVAATVVPCRAAATKAQILGCHGAIYSGARYLGTYVQLGATTCVQKANACTLAFEVNGTDPTLCLLKAADSCSVLPAKVANREFKSVLKAQVYCSYLTLAEMAQWVGGLGHAEQVGPPCNATDTNGMVSCIMGAARCRVEQTVSRADPRAQDALTTLGIAGAFPCVGIP